MKRKKKNRKYQKKFDLYEVPEFEKKFRGYDTEEVDKYLNALVDAYEKMYNECEALRKEADEYRLHKDRIAKVLIKAEIAASPASEEAGSAEGGPYS